MTLPSGVTVADVQKDGIIDVSDGTTTLTLKLSNSSDSTYLNVSPDVSVEGSSVDVVVPEVKAMQNTTVTFEATVPDEPVMNVIVEGGEYKFSVTSESGFRKSLLVFGGIAAAGGIGGGYLAYKGSEYAFGEESE
jgi:hypothetical protein